MTDFVLKVRLGIQDSTKNKKLILKFSEWLNQEYPNPSYTDHALDFVKKVLESAQVPFEGSMTTEVTNSAKSSYLDGLRHPKIGKGGKWFLDDLQLKNGSAVWIKLENQWIKARVEIKDNIYNIVIEPENVSIPISESLFMRW